MRHNQILVFINMATNGELWEMDQCENEVLRLKAIVEYNPSTMVLKM